MYRYHVESRMGPDHSPIICKKLFVPRSESIFSCVKNASMINMLENRDGVLHTSQTQIKDYIIHLFKDKYKAQPVAINIEHYVDDYLEYQESESH